MKTFFAFASWRQLASVVAALLLAAFGVTPAYAVHSDGYFQLDGDAKAATCGTAFGGLGCVGDDWDSLYTCISPPTGLGCTRKDPGVGNGAKAISVLIVDLAPASIFRGGGSKDEKDISQWNWADGSVPDKDDLIEAFAALYEPAGGPRANHKILYFGANRLSINGDAQIGFWFLQKSVSLKADGTFQDSQGNPAKHQIGDVLILSNFVQGGGSSNIQVYKVIQVTPGPCPAGSVETNAGNGDICLQQIVNGTAGANGVCNPATATVGADAACAATNGAVVDALDPDFTAKSGANTGQYPIVGFFEGGLDLTAVGLGNECFPTFVVETRSSQSITAVLKDFTIGQFENCAAAIRTEIHQAPDNSDADLQMTTIAASSVVHDLAIVNGTIGAPVPTGTVSFKFFATFDCTGNFSQQLNVPLIVGATEARANSSNTAPLAPGVYSFNASYNGDGNYPPVGPSNCEPLTVDKFTSNTATHIFTVDASGNLLVDKTDSFIDLAGAASQPMRDQAVVTKVPVAAGDPTPTGTVEFTRFQFSNCTGTTSTETINLGTCPGTSPPAGTATACSTVFNLGPNTLGWKAKYNGDSNYKASTLSRCEPVCAIDTTK